MVNIRITFDKIQCIKKFTFHSIRDGLKVKRILKRLSHRNSQFQKNTFKNP